MIPEEAENPTKTSANNVSKKKNAFKEAAVSATRMNQDKYRGLFEANPISLWEEDFSEVKFFLDRLSKKGVTDFREYFDTHPEEIAYTTSLVKIKDVNQATLQLYKAPSKEVLLNNLHKVVGPDSRNVIKEQLITIAENRTAFEAEGSNYTLEGDKIDVVMRWIVPPGFEHSYSQIIISIFDVTSQKQAEKQLKLQATALESVANAIVVTDTKANIAWINPAYTKLTGYTSDEVIGKHVSELIPAADREIISKGSHRALAADRSWRHENMIQRRKDGSHYYQDVTITPVRDSNGQVINYVAVIEDITARKQIEIQLRKQLQEEEMLRQIVAVNPAVNELNDALNLICEKLSVFYEIPSVNFTLLDKEAMLADVIGEYLSSELLENNGQVIPLANIVPIDNMIRQKSAEFIPNVQEAPRFEQVRDILQAFDNHSALLVPVAAAEPFQGLLAFDTVQPGEFSQDDIQFIEQVAHHIGQMLQRVQMEQKLQKQQDFARQVMNNMGQGLLVLRADRTIEFCNPAFANLVGYEQQELVGRSLMELVKIDTQTAVAEPTEAERAVQKSVREIELIHANGRETHVLLTGVPRNQHIVEDGAICVVTDLSAQKKIENALAQARDRAMEASRLKSEFLANMSHEIRTPLNAVIGMTSLLLDSPLTAEQQDYAQTIHSSGEILLSLIKDILDFSKIEAGKLELEKRPFVVRDYVERTLDVVVSKAAEKGLELGYIIDDAVPNEIVDDANRVRQILVNLLNNAIKFTEQGEVILTISVDNQAQTTNDTDIVLHFSVEDTGIGILPENFDRLFKSFTQVDASNTRKYGGSGLGLAICKQLVDMMGGKIWVESKYGQGSTFHFTITTTGLPARQHLYPQHTVAQLNNKRLLLVNDNTTISNILRKQTEAWGLVTKTAQSGSEAMALLEQGAPFDVAILDSQLSDMDNLTLASEIQKLPGAQTLPLIMLSTISERDKRKSAPCFVAHLTKPVKQRALFENLLTILSNSNFRPESVAPKLEIDSRMGEKQPLRILLAEDNLVNQKVAVRLLERLGYQTDVATDGLEVLEALKATHYDVIFMDVQMPQMDGVAATEQIRNVWPAAEQPYIIAMTANALNGDREKYLTVGMDDYLSKPVKIQDVAHALAKVNQNMP